MTTQHTEHSNTNHSNKSYKYVDLLDEDPDIGDQRYCCVSFVSPENILKKREDYFFGEFIKNWEFEKSVKRMSDFLNFIAFKYNIRFDKLMEDFQDYLGNEKERLLEDSKNVKIDYDSFLETNEDRLQKEFDEKHNFQTSTRGLKIRGSYATNEEAQLRAKLLRERDPNHDIYVGRVGVWMPWNPDAYRTGKVQHLEEELNTLMTEKQANEDKAKEEFDNRLRETKRKAMEDNIEKAKQYGNKLTQNLNEEEELVGTQEANTIENKLVQENEVVSGADVRRELFEGDNVRTKEKDEEYKKHLIKRFNLKDENENGLQVDEVPQNKVDVSNQS